MIRIRPFSTAKGAYVSFILFFTAWILLMVAIGSRDLIVASGDVSTDSYKCTTMAEMGFQRYFSRVSCQAFQQGVPKIEDQTTLMDNSSSPPAIPFSNPCVTAAFAFGILSSVIGFACIVLSVLHIIQIGFSGHVPLQGLFLLSLLVSLFIFFTLTLGVGYYQYNCPVPSGCPISPISQSLVASFFLWNFGIGACFWLPWSSIGGSRGSSKGSIFDNYSS